MNPDDLDLLEGQINSLPVSNAAELESYRLHFFNKKGALGHALSELKNLDGDQKRQTGMRLNLIKQAAEARLQTASELLTNQSQAEPAPYDLTLPPPPRLQGARHPLSLVREQIISIFERIGFNIADGPEIEDDWHNFGALNFPPNHPARDMQDTFFVGRNPDIALRTHTSSVQVRLLGTQKPPVRALMPGRVFRNENISARAHCQFHQIEGICINENISFADLKNTLYYFVKELFGPDTKIRFRPSFFPFTEPSAEIDVSCNICKGVGCSVCKHSGWVEIGGSGMIHPNVLENCDIDPKIYTGYAFGMGIERMAMLKYEIKDLRLFFENDLRFLQQFGSQG